jgi:hypothetical protein
MAADSAALRGTGLSNSALILSTAADTRFTANSFKSEPGVTTPR